MKHNSDIIDLLVRSRSNLVELIIIGVFLALGINLVANAAAPLLNLAPLGSFLVGTALAIIAMACLSAKLFGGREQVREYESVFIYDAEKNDCVLIPGYEFGEGFAHYLRGAFAENPALKAIWDREPLRNIPERVWGRSKQEEKCPRAMELVSEAAEYYVLNKLSTHLTDYFSDASFRETNLRKYSRMDIPHVLLSNRFLELFSRPMIDRPLFVQQGLDERDEETTAVWNEDGSMYASFDLILPKGSEIRRPQPYTVEIKTARMVLSIETDFRGLSANLPRGFARFYLGITKFENEEFFSRFMELEIHTRVRVSFKFGALVSTTGWEYYRWVDSFLGELDSDLSAEHFFSNINWESVHAILMAINNTGRAAS